ncbi:MAG TPA: alpha-E domain-containing protein, partial [Woeseiaceae bacterium]
MLARVAERTYWLARYLERTENLARLCNVFGKLFLDLPRSSLLGWSEILKIIDVDPAASGADGTHTDTQAIELLIARRDNSSSLIASLAAA